MLIPPLVAEIPVVRESSTDISSGDEDRDALLVELDREQAGPSTVAGPSSASRIITGAILVFFRTKESL